MFLILAFQVRAALESSRLFSSGSELLRRGDPAGALPPLRRCAELRRSCLYGANEEVAAAEDRLAQCHAAAGDYREAAGCLRKCLEAVKYRYFIRYHLNLDMEKFSSTAPCPV